VIRAFAFGAIVQMRDAVHPAATLFSKTLQVLRALGFLAIKKCFVKSRFRAGFALVFSAVLLWKTESWFVPMGSQRA
jgi:hypothetical protein